MKRIVTLGEIMLRLSTPGFERFVQADNFDACYGGGEANVCVSLANYGLDARFITKVPKHEIGQSAVNALRKYGVDTTYIARGGERLGIYYLESGASQRPSKVIYDRAHAAIAEADSSDFNWKEIFDGIDWFHFTGITPALSDKAAGITLEACKAAKEMGLTVSVDLNYRKKLWTPEKAGEVMATLMPYVDVCIGNEEDAEKVFGIHADDTDITKGEINHEAYEGVAKKLIERFGFKYVASTLRESHSASDNGWSALLYDGEKSYLSKKYDVRIVDRVGGGDSFASGLIYGLITEMPLQEALEFAVAASALKHTIPGDANLVSTEEVETLMKGDGSGRVQR
ncbi:sugar kinase [Alkaliphilus peptidifermentans]|uniref:2-dehydro-3-deoxygluconokinase n=1 Tax=Alkaliphilus peptidifermentans DSM 18978 TaxID=1120976 RepID=A0A1G5F1X3_9FIRM|nr:sugar kinase [Alkaliphilus peptidifermentans]SCY32628.1 2-dehydro-3-deoxygluconokinase [Alkaliphilus peptidifermentans DSM 18978]